MSQKTLNLGILAHVDAGKTTLTERLLHAAGVIDEVGSVDRGTTQTDSLALERQRGITIKSAVASFAIDDVTVNLIDTPGHPDFIAEVERVLSVLDGAVLVVSAVERVQAQTPLLMRALQRLQVPTLIFVNKIDRVGADEERTLEAIAERLTPGIVPLGSVDAAGTRDAGFAPWRPDDSAFRARLAEVLAEGDDGILAAFVDDEAGLSYGLLVQALAAQAKRGVVHPVLFGSASTGAGVKPLMAAVAQLLPAAAGDADGPVSGAVFKVERGPAGEKIAYVRLFSGTIRTRDRVRFGRDGEDKVTAIGVFDRGAPESRSSVSAGQIAKLWGLGAVRVGDPVGRPHARLAHRFAPPTLESVVAPRARADKEALRVALGQLAEQDPLIDVRQDGTTQELSVSLYGEVQKEVIGATLAAEFGLDVTFRETTTIYVERPSGTGSAVEALGDSSNPFLATVGLRVNRAPVCSGVDVRLDVPVRSVPMYVYKNQESFGEMVAGYVRGALREGLRGWEVTDCQVTMTHCGYAAPSTTAADFRKLMPLVLMRALERAGTVVCEPVVRVGLEVPSTTVGSVLPVLARLGAIPPAPSPIGRLSRLETVLPAARVQELRRRLPGLTGGECVLETDFAGYRPVNGTAPVRPRATPDPLNRKEYLLHIKRRV